MQYKKLRWFLCQPSPLLIVPDFWSSDVNVFELGDSSVSVRDRDPGHLAVHVVLGLHQATSVDLSGNRLTGYDVTFGLEKGQSSKN